MNSIERGDTRQFTWSSSFNPAQVGLGLIDNQGALVQSVVGVGSSSLEFYGFLSFPNSYDLGFYTVRWDAWASSKQYITDELIRLVDITAVGVSSYYADSEAVRRTWNLLNAGGGSQLQNEDIEVFLDRVNFKIDAYLVGRYTLPFSSVPGLVRNLSVDLTVYQIARKSVQRDDRGNLPDWITEMKDDAFDTLEMLQAGSLDLVTDTGALWPGDKMSGRSDFFHSQAGVRDTFNELDPAWQRQDFDHLKEVFEDVWS